MSPYRKRASVEPEIGPTICARCKWRDKDDMDDPQYWKCRAPIGSLNFVTGEQATVDKYCEAVNDGKCKRFELKP